MPRDFHSGKDPGFLPYIAVDASSPWIFLQGKIAELCWCKYQHWLASVMIILANSPVSVQINPLGSGRSILLREARRLAGSANPAFIRSFEAVDSSWISAYVWNQDSAVEQEDVAQAEKSCVSSHLICGPGVDKEGGEP